MKITYLYHSGFALEFEKVSVVIDYYDEHTGKRSAEECPALAGILADNTRKLYVLASHRHYDHFDPSILDFWRTHCNITYVFSNDIQAEITQLEVNVPVSCIGESECYSDEYISIHAFGSTDEGISFLLNIDGTSVFHAGDLNNWHWNEECPPEEAAGYEANYLHELEKIAEFSPSIDVAMFPLDPRLGKDFAKGAEQFIARIKTVNFIPMHFRNNFSIANQFEPIAKAHDTNFFALTHKCQTINLPY